MATRKPAKKIIKASDYSQVKTLNPRDPDTEYLGPEPMFAVQPDEDRRRVALMRSFTWYGRFYGKKDAKEFLAQYLDLRERPQEAKIMRRIDEKECINTLCWLARMELRGLELSETESDTLQKEINRLLETINKPQVIEAIVPDAPARPNIQEILKDKAREAAGELEGLFDEYITSGAGAKHTLRPIDEVAKKNVMPQHISLLTDVWKKKLNEIEEVLKGTDSQLVQGYSHLTKTQLKNVVKFIELVISDLNSYISVKKAAKAPRARKAVPVEKQVAKLKYLKTFKDTASKLDLVSISPIKLHGASECYLYDTAKRKLIYMCADDYSKTFTVKGTTILGFDTTKSQSKTLRRPADQLKDFLKLGKPAGRKFFDDIKAVSITPNGRTNENMIIIKAW